MQLAEPFGAPLLRSRSYVGITAHDFGVFTAMDWRGLARFEIDDSLPEIGSDKERERNASLHMADQSHGPSQT